MMGRSGSESLDTQDESKKEDRPEVPPKQLPLGPVRLLLVQAKVPRKSSFKVHGRGGVPTAQKGRKDNSSKGKFLI